MILTMASRVSSPVVIGRDQERNVLEDVLARAATGGGAGVVLVGGEAGIGKTRLLDDAASTAADEGFLVLRGGCVSLGSDEGLPFAPIAEALRGVVNAVPPDVLAPMLDASTDELASLVPQLSGPVAPASGGARPDWAQTRILEGLLALLERLGAWRPVLLVVEDLHWADRSTREVLAFLARTLRAERVVLAASYRTDELHRRHPLRAWLAETERLARVVRIQLVPLTADEVAALVRELLGADAVAEQVDAVVRRSAGNPFFAEELVASGVMRDTDRLPDTLRDLLLVRIHALPDLAQEVLGAAAVAGVRVDEPLLQAASGLDEGALAAGLREALGARLLVEPGDGTDRFSFRHALVREAMYAEVLPKARRAMHERCARYLDALPAAGGVAGSSHLAAIAHHATAAHDLPRALRGWIDAARASAAVYALAEAADAFDRAIDLWDAVPDAETVTGTDLVQLHFEASLALIGSGELLRARDVARTALQLLPPDADPRRDALVRERYARALWLAGELHESVAVLDDAVERLRGLPPSEEVARVMASLAGILVLRDRNVRSAELGEEAVAMARAVGARSVETYAICGLGIAYVNTGDCERGLRLAAEARAMAHEQQLSAIDMHRVYANESSALQICGDLEASVRSAMDGVSWARTHSLWRLQGSFLESNAAAALFEMGRWDEAAELLSTGRGEIREGVARLNHALVAGTLAVRRGELAVAHGLLGEARDAVLRIRDAQFCGPIFVGFVSLALAEGRLDVATADAALAVELMQGTENTGARFGMELAWLAVLAVRRRIAEARARGDEAAIAARLDEASDWMSQVDRLEPDLIPRLRGFGQEGVGFAAMARAEVAGLEGEPNPDRWAAIVRHWTDVDRPWPRAVASLRLAEDLLRSGARRAMASAPLGEALAIARHLRAVPLEREALVLARSARVPLTADGAATAYGGSEAGEPEPPPGASFGLTEREREVLALVVEGYSNRRIGEALYMSESTAGVHVSNIIGKLGVANRVEAAAMAVRHGIA
jgi:ATP/maltotriose-dependent transcriptional regulator MalT